MGASPLSDRSTELFGHALRQLRTLQGLSMAEFGERSRLAEALVDELEGGRRLPDLDELFALGAGLGMTVAAIMRVWENGKLDAK